MIHIVFNIDRNYISQCKNVMKSILANTKSKVKFHIIGEEIEGCECYKIPDVSNLKVTVNPHTLITESAVYRLYIPDMIKADKCIYLDSDIIVLDDIQKLWDIDIKYIGGVLDPLAVYQAGKNNLKHKYINSGVMVLNLKNLRKINYWERIHNAQANAKNLSLVDQDTINIAFTDLIENLPEEWNVYSKIYAQTTKEMLKARENPSIIHWCGSQKPWNSNVWNGEKWFKYKGKKDTIKKAIVLTYAPVSKADAKLLKETDIFKIATNFSAAELKPNVRLTADDIVDKCLECDTCPVVSLNYDLHKQRVIDGSKLPKRYTSLVSCIDYLLFKGYTDILLVASNPESATQKRNYEYVSQLNNCLYLYKYTNEGYFDIPYKSIGGFIKMTDEDKILGIKENPEEKLDMLALTDSCLYEVYTKGYNNKSISNGQRLSNILSVEYKQKLIKGELEIEYNGLVIKRLTGSLLHPVEEVITEQPIEKPIEQPKPIKKAVRKVAKKKVSKK